MDKAPDVVGIEVAHLDEDRLRLVRGEFTPLQHVEGLRPQGPHIGGIGSAPGLIKGRGCPVPRGVLRLGDLLQHREGADPVTGGITLQSGQLLGSGLGHHPAHQLAVGSDLLRIGLILGGNLVGQGFLLGGEASQLGRTGRLRRAQGFLRRLQPPGPVSILRRPARIVGGERIGPLNGQPLDEGLLALNRGRGRWNRRRRRGQGGGGGENQQSSEYQSAHVPILRALTAR